MFKTYEIKFEFETGGQVKALCTFVRAYRASKTDITLQMIDPIVPILIIFFYLLT